MLPPIHQSQRRLRHISDEEAGLNLTPLIDIIFILIFFFFMATEVRRDMPSVPIELPQLTDGGTAINLEEKKRIVVSITSDGEIYIDREEAPTPQDQVATRLRELRTTDDMNVVVRVDDGARAGIYNDILVQVRSAGLTKIKVLIDEETTTSP